MVAALQDDGAVQRLFRPRPVAADDARQRQAEERLTAHVPFGVVGREGGEEGLPLWRRRRSAGDNSPREEARRRRGGDEGSVRRSRSANCERASSSGRFGLRLSLRAGEERARQRVVPRAARDGVAVVQRRPWRCGASPVACARTIAARQTSFLSQAARHPEPSSGAASATARAGSFASSHAWARRVVRGVESSRRRPDFRVARAEERDGAIARPLRAGRVGELRCLHDHARRQIERLARARPQDHRRRRQEARVATFTARIDPPRVPRGLRGEVRARQAGQRRRRGHPSRRAPPPP